MANKIIFTQPVCYEFKNILCPTLLIIGKRDRTAPGKNKVARSVQQSLDNDPVLGRQTARKVRNARLTELEDVGQLPNTAAFEQFIDPLLQFF